MSNTLATFFDNSEGYTYSCIEGDISIDEGLSTLNGAKLKFVNFANPIDAETFVIFGEAPISIKKPICSTSENPVLVGHITQYEPEWRTGEIPQPKGSATTLPDGQYKRRIVVAYKLRHGEMTLPLSSTNTAIKPGDKLHIDVTTGGVDKAPADSISNVTSLENAKANTGGYIVASLPDGVIPTSPCASEDTTSTIVDISASVTDGTEAISGVTVTLTDSSDSTKTFTATTGSAGGCTISNVPTGDYSVKAEKTGYDDYTSTITVTSSTTTLDITMNESS